MHYIKVIDNITANIQRDGQQDLGKGYEGTDDLTKAEALLVRSSDIHQMEFSDKICCIARSGAGTNNIPVDTCAQNGIVVFNAPGANANAVKELVCGLILVSSRGTLDGIKWVQDNLNDPDIKKNAERIKKQFVGQEIAGRKVAVIGLGEIGVKVANALVALEMEVYGFDPFLSVRHAWALSRHVHCVSTLEEACQDAEYLTIHVPATKATLNMIGKEQIDQFKPGATLLDFARMDVVDASAVKAALASGQLKHFVCDFPTPETAQMPHVIITPHLGASTTEAQENCARMAISEMKNYIENGTIANSVNYPALDMGSCYSAARYGMLHANKPGIIAQISTIIGNSSANIDKMANEARNDNAYTLVDTDKPLDAKTLEALSGISNMRRVRVIKPA